MKYLFITALLSMKIDSVLTNPISVGNEVFLTNNSKHFASKISPNQAMSIGGLENSYLFNNNPVLISTRDLKNLEESHSEIVNFLRDCLAFLHALWLTQDNNVNMMLGFAISGDGRHTHSNSLSYFFSNCSGSRSDSVFSEAQLSEIADKYKDVLSGMRTDMEPEHTRQVKEFGRFNAGVNFVQQARSTPDIGLKIANYCSFFESLLSSTSTELAHQMAERAAFYLRSSPSERLEHYSMSKKAYNIRSRIVHGAALGKKDLKEIITIGKHCDDMARELSVNTIEDKQFLDAQSGSGEDLDRFFIHKIFGISNDA